VTPRRHSSVLALCFWAICFCVQAQAAPTNCINHFSVRSWQTDDGLPQNSVFAITQTSDGYLWIGTREGLARFDGTRFVVVDEKSAPELKRGWITALCATRDGSLWVACENTGLTRLYNGGIEHYGENDGLAGNQPRCLLEAKDGALWIGTETGLSRFKDGKFVNFTQKNGLGDNSIRALCEDRQGAIRAATRRGLSALTKDLTISTINFGMGTTSNALKSVCEDQQGTIWVSSNDAVTREGEGRRIYTSADGLPDKIATALLSDREGRVWAGTYAGLACLQEGTVTCRPLNEAGLGDLVYTIFEDNEGDIWAGARDGLYFIKPARFTAYTTQEGLTHNNVMSVMEDKSGAIWMATWGGGVNILRDGKVSVFMPTNSPNRNDSALSLYEGHDGSIWIGMDFDGGLHRLKGTEHTGITWQKGLYNTAIRAIHEDAHGDLWIGTTLGLNVIRKGKFSSYNTGKGLAGNFVMDICESASGDIWLGTDGGLSRWNHGKFSNFTTAQGLSQNYVDVIYEDSEHTLWLGTKGGGLNRYKDGKFTVYTTKQGLFSDEIYAIVEDDFGYFWLSCRMGIFRVQKKDFEELDRGRIRALACTGYGKADGLPSIQCNGFVSPAGWKGRDGRLWFPTIRGAVAVDSRIRSNDKPPPVAIEQVVADRRPLTAGISGWLKGVFAKAHVAANALDIQPGRGELDIQYSALSLRGPDKNRFKYMLDKVDADWVDAGNRREAHYTQLGPGTYRFRVVAANNDGVWNESGATLYLRLMPHFWQTLWFKGSIPVAAGLLFAAFYHVRMTRLREIERLRIQIAADLHDDVGSRLTKVAMVTELVDRETPAAETSKPHIANIARTTREVIQAMDEIVWTINPKNDTLDNLANYIFQYAQEYFQNTGVRCRLDFPARLPDVPLSTEERHNVFMAVKEALNNVLKHAGATDVRVGFTAENGSLSIVISDNGRGFDKSTVNGSGDGLNNMKSRLNRIGGQLRLESSTGGGGTRVEMDAPLN